MNERAREDGERKARDALLEAVRLFRQAADMTDDEKEKERLQRSADRTAEKLLWRAGADVHAEFELLKRIRRQDDE